MSVESEILRIQHNISDTYATVSSKGGEVPLQPTSANLAAAVRSITSSGELIAGDGLSKEGDTLSVDNPVHGILTQAEFDTLTAEEKASGTYFVDDGQTGGSSWEVYDDQERVIGTWFGKPLYRRVLSGTVPSDAYGSIDGVVIPDIGNINDVDTIVNISFSLLKNDYVLTSVQESLATLKWNKSLKTLLIVLNSKYNIGGRLNAIIEYTKTTDPEVSA